MASSGMLHRVALVRTDVWEQLTRATRRNIPEDAILHSHSRENLNSYSVLLVGKLYTRVHSVTLRLDAPKTDRTSV
jgi:hypothetical protein